MVLFGNKHILNSLLTRIIILHSLLSFVSTSAIKIPHWIQILFTGFCGSENIFRRPIRCRRCRISPFRKECWQGIDFSIFGIMLRMYELPNSIGILALLMLFFLCQYRCNLLWNNFSWTIFLGKKKQVVVCIDPTFIEPKPKLWTRNVTCKVLTLWIVCARTFE